MQDLPRTRGPYRSEMHITASEVTSSRGSFLNSLDWLSHEMASRDLANLVILL